MRSKIAFLTALLVPATAMALDQATLEQAYDRITPAMCLVQYTSEVTNPQTGQVNKRDSSAVGVLVSPDGLVMVHGHMVLEDAQPYAIKVTVGRGDNEKEYDAALLRKPDDINVVFLKITPETGQKFPFLRFAAEPGLRVGSPVGLFGVLPDALDNERALRVGYIGAILEKPRTTYCLDSPVGYNHVGGPVVNEAGEIVGVLGFDLSRAEGGELYSRSGYPLVYQAKLFRKYIANPPGEDTIEEGRADAWLGVYTQPLTDDFAEYWGLSKDGGLIVSTVVPASPAESAGILSGDVIREFDGTPIKSKLDREVISFTKLVRDTGPEKTVTVRFLRDGEPKSVDVKLTTRPRSARDADEYEDDVFGLTVREITVDVRIALNLPEDVRGVIVRRVESGGVAQLGNMRPGVIILSLGDFPIATLDDYKAAVAKVAEAKPTEVPVFARYGTATGFFRLTPRWGE